MNKNEIKPFEFMNLVSDHVVTHTPFKPFEFENLKNEVQQETKEKQEQIKSEREFAQKNNFQIDDIVRDSRGLLLQEKNELEKRIQSEVDKKIEDAFKKAYDEGLAKGREEGFNEAKNQYLSEVEQKVSDLNLILEQVNSQTHHVIDNNRSDIYEFIKRFTKWIILKEIDPKIYLEGLLEKLVLELNSRKNIIVKVGKDNFSEMPEVISAVEAKLGQLSNLRIEIVPEVNYPGIILESENGLIDGSLEGVFQNIDKIFEQVLNHE